MLASFQYDKSGIACLVQYRCRSVAFEVPTPAPEVKQRLQRINLPMVKDYSKNGWNLCSAFEGAHIPGTVPDRWDGGFSLFSTQVAVQVDVSRVKPPGFLRTLVGGAEADREESI
jgi:hypothetical protein